MQSIYYFVANPHPVYHPIPSFNFGKKLGLSKEVGDNLELGERSGQNSRIPTGVSMVLSKWILTPI